MVENISKLYETFLHISKLYFEFQLDTFDLIQLLVLSPIDPSDLISPPVRP